MKEIIDIDSLKKEYDIKIGSKHFNEMCGHFFGGRPLKSKQEKKK